jgi:rfaE bifunctional protein nucleotidyltransferase chain/domain
MGQVGSLAQVAQGLAAARAQGKKVVLANGAFDLLHVGHVRYLQAAKRFADVLVVAVNSDLSVRGSKGPERPIVPEAERCELVAALGCVDWVVLFDEPTVAAVITALRPDFQAKGTDYTEDNVPEGPLVRSYGGRVVIAGDPKDHSTTDVLSRLRR